MDIIHADKLQNVYIKNTINICIIISQCIIVISFNINHNFRSYIAGFFSINNQYNSQKNRGHKKREKRYNITTTKNKIAIIYQICHTNILVFFCHFILYP